jgi:Fe2+ or Zn2+ uptake regulation protein
MQLSCYKYKPVPNSTAIYHYKYKAQNLMSSQLIQKINLALKPKGYRQSNLRDSIVGILDLSDEPVTVVEILEKLKTEKHDPNKTTVYRELSTLVENNFVSEVDLSEGKKRYELKTDATHPHMVCNVCGSVKCARLNITIESWLKSFSVQNNFEMNSYNLQFYGLCDSCQHSQNLK